MSKSKYITAKVKTNDIRPEDRVPLKEKLAYGIGGLMDGGGVSMMSCVMLKYMTSMGIAMAVASTIMMVAKIWDAITDPFMGFISDNTRGRWGRRKPYMFFGGISLIIAIFLVFLPIRDWGVSVEGFTAFIIIMYLVWNTCSTITQVPYCSMASDITPSFRERNNANTVKLVFTVGSDGILAVHGNCIRHAVRRRTYNLRTVRKGKNQSQNSQTEIQCKTLRKQLCGAL